LNFAMDFSNFFDYGVENTTRPDSAALVFLPHCSEQEWEQLLAVAERRAVRAGEIVVQQGEESRVFYIVASGQLEVFLTNANGQEHIISDIGSLSIFGEQAFFDGLPRSASVRAMQDSEVYAIHFERFEVLAGHHPTLARKVLVDLGRIVSLRLREMNALVYKSR
jgi:CRP/FNR family cyclic AMP-dependent transcriptional regulator